MVLQNLQEILINQKIKIYKNIVIDKNLDNNKVKKDLDNKVKKDLDNKVKKDLDNKVKKNDIVIF